MLDLPENKLSIVVNAYKNGDYKFTIQGKEYNWGDLKELKIFRNESSFKPDDIESYCQEKGGWIQVFGAGHLISPDLLERLGPDVTEEFLGDVPFGGQQIKIGTKEEFINPARIESLEKVDSKEFDLSKMIAICKELNSNWTNDNYFTVGLLLRTIINHVPPIFGNTFTTFSQVIGHYGTQSFKKNMDYLNVSLRSIADSYTHDLIRKKESLPTHQQVDFRANIDLLLSEIIRLLDQKD